MAKKSTRRGADPWPLGQRPGFLIRRLHQIHVALFQEKCAEFEITPLQYSLLSALAVRKTADQTTLAADVSLDRTTTTGALKRLQSRRFVERAVRRDDARAAHRDTLASLSKPEQKRFVVLMQQIVAANAFKA
jgi:DNA-binding MarR family transcriptional regulator